MQGARENFSAKFPRSPVGWIGSLGLHLIVLILALAFVSHEPARKGVSEQEISIGLAPLSGFGAPPSKPSATSPDRSQHPVTENPAAAPAAPEQRPLPIESAPETAIPDSSVERPEESSGAQGAPPSDAGAADLGTLISMLLNQMKRCWIPPAEKSHSITLSFRLSFNEDGTVASPPDLLGVVDDPYFRAAADATRRALYECAPFSLPRSRYSEWEEIANFTFDPSEMNTN